LEGLATRQGDVRALVVSCYGRRGPAGIVLVGLLAAALLSGCSTGDAVSTVMIDPAHYSVYHCDGLQARLKALQSREQELSNLMLRASEGGARLDRNLTIAQTLANALGGEGAGARRPRKSAIFRTAAAGIVRTCCIHRHAGRPAAPPLTALQSDQGIR
jgi:hypothetical protein